MCVLGQLLEANINLTQYDGYTGEKTIINASLCLVLFYAVSFTTYYVGFISVLHRRSPSIFLPDGNSHQMSRLSFSPLLL